MQHQVLSCLSYHLHHRVRTAIAVQGLLLLPRGEGWDGAKNEDGVDVLFRTGLDLPHKNGGRNVKK
jgi:hypothetical protein